MVDLKINQKGDLDMTDYIPYPKFKMTFGINDLPFFRFDFTQGKSNSFEVPNNSFCFSFKPSVQVGSKISHGVFGMEEMRQKIMILLKTELGDIKNAEDFGTLIRTLKHLDITSDQVIRQIQDTVLSSVKDYLNDPKVKVEKKKKDGPFFCQNVNVYIYDGDTEIYEFEIEG